MHKLWKLSLHGVSSIKVNICYNVSSGQWLWLAYRLPDRINLQGQHARLTLI